MFRYVLAWLPLLIIAILNGVLRDVVYGRFMSELLAHQISTIFAAMLFGVYIRALMHFWRPDSSAQAFNIGLLWLAMTVAFEFLFMHFVAGYSWHTLLHNYNILAGRVWPLLLLWIAIAPYIFYQLQKSKQLH